MAKVNMIGSDGVAFTTSLKKSRVHLDNGTATLAGAPKKVAAKAPAKKVAAKKAASKAPAKKAAAKKSYSTRALKAD